MLSAQRMSSSFEEVAEKRRNHISQDDDQVVIGCLENSSSYVSHEPKYGESGSHGWPKIDQRGVMMHEAFVFLCTEFSLGAKGRGVSS